MLKAQGSATVDDAVPSPGGNGGLWSSHEQSLKGDKGIKSVFYIAWGKERRAREETASCFLVSITHMAPPVSPLSSFPPAAAQMTAHLLRMPACESIGGGEK